MKNAFRQFRAWSAGNYLVYSCISIPSWAIIYTSLYHNTYSVPIALSLLGFQLAGLVMLIISATAWKKYRR